MRNYKFYIVLGIITIVSSILTIIITQIIKVILKKKKIIYEGIEKSKKDMILKRCGRIVALVVYTSIYIVKEIYLKQTIIIDETLLTGLLTGATGTLLLAKSIYTILHQWSEKNTVYERLEYAEKVNYLLNEELNKVNIKIEKPKIKWILTNKRKGERK